MKAPRYAHDCTVCKFLGRDGRYDVYVCCGDDKELTHQTYLARRSGDPGDYASFPRMVFANTIANHITDNVVDAKGQRIKNCKFPDWMQAVLRVLFRTHKG
jgi:hypothetical protein